MSAPRVIVVTEDCCACGPLAWPTAQPQDDLDYGLDVSALLLEGGDQVVTASVAAAPSGTGELAPSSVSVSGDVVTTWLAGGVAGRSYLVRVLLGTAYGRTFELLVNLNVSQTLGEPSPPEPPSLAFGTPVTWSYSMSVSTELEAALVLSAVPCRLLSVQITTTAVGGIATLLDAAAAPVNGAIAPTRVWQLTAHDTLDLSFQPPLSLTDGAVLAFSSGSDPYTYVASATGFFAGEVA